MEKMATYLVQSGISCNRANYDRGLLDRDLTTSAPPLTVLQNNARTCHLCFHLGPSSPPNRSPIPEHSRTFPNHGHGVPWRSNSRGCWPWRWRPPSSPWPHPPAASSSRPHPPAASSSHPHRALGSRHSHDCSRMHIHNSGHPLHDVEGLFCLVDLLDGGTIRVKDSIANG
jgi:hypothetical protein